MHTIAKLGLAAALLMGTANLAIAQDLDVDAGVDAGIDAGAVGVDTTTTGSIGGSFDSLLSSLDAGADVSSVTDESVINFVTVSSLEGEAGADPAALDAALTEKTEQLAMLHSDIEANAALMAKIEAAGYTADDVIGTESGADSTFTFYVDDRS